MFHEMINVVLKDPQIHHVVVKENLHFHQVVLRDRLGDPFHTKFSEPTQLIHIMLNVFKMGQACRTFA